MAILRIKISKVGDLKLFTAYPQLLNIFYNNAQVF